MAELPPRYAKEDVKILSETLVFRGFFQVKEYQFQRRNFDGSWSEVLNRELFERGEASAVLLYDPKLDTVVLCEQFRIGAIHDPDNFWQYEIVAGMIDAGVSPEDVARKETKEEANVVISELIPIMHYFSSPGGMSEKIHVFCAIVDSRNIGGIHGAKHENEDIRLHVVSREAAYHYVEQGIISNAVTIIAIQWLQLNYRSKRFTEARA